MRTSKFTVEQIAHTLRRVESGTAVLGVALSSVRYGSVRPPQGPLRRRIHEIASARVSYGYRRV